MKNARLHRALVTGGTGFVGSHLVERLVSDGWEVHLIVRGHSSLKLIQGILDKIVLHRHDGSTPGMLAIVEQAKPTVVFHLASLFLAQHKPDDIEALVRDNVLFATQLVEAMTAFGVKCLVNTGTSWQHFENEDYSPVNLYAATKQAFAAILHYYLETGSLRAITLKLFDTYGPGDPRPKLLALLRKVAREQTPLAMSPGEQLIDLVHVDDVVEAFFLAGERLLAGEVRYHETYAVSSGRPVKLRDLVEIYGKVIGRQLPVEWGGRAYRSREVMVPWNKGEFLPGWLPRIDFEEGIRALERIGQSNSEKQRPEDDPQCSPNGKAT